MKNPIIIFLIITTLFTYAHLQKTSVIPLKVERNKTHVTVNIGDVIIPNILLDTGFAFDGLMIYNPDYKDSLDLTNSREVRIGGAGSGEDSKASMIDSAAFNLGVLQGDTYKGFPSNGIIGYSIFGHYITELDYDNYTMTLYDIDKINIDSSWAAIPLYFKNNNIPWLDASVVIGDESPISLAMYIDYAAGDAIVLLEKTDMKFLLPVETADVHIGRGLSGDIYGKTGKISELIIGPYTLKNVNASFAQSEVRSKQDNADAILGSGSLRRFNLIFDYSNKWLYLKPNTHFKDTFN
jgi:hypothetical protein